MVVAFHTMFAAGFYRRSHLCRAAVFGAACAGLILGEGEQAFASPGCTALNGSNKGMVVTGSHVGAGGFVKGDTLIVQVLDSTITAIIWDDTTNTRITTYTNGSFRYVVPATTSDTLMVEFELRPPFNGSASWSCSTAGSSPGSSSK